MKPEWMPSRQAIRNGLLVFLVVLGIALLSYSTLESIVTRWFKFDESYSHGILLAAVSALLIVRAARNYPITPDFYPLWILPFALSLAVYWLGGLIRLQALEQLVLLPMVLSGLAVILGWHQVKSFIVPICLLAFTIPVWDFLSWTLQLITVAVNQFLLGFLDIDFQIEGVFVYLIGVGTFEVAHGCSGLRYLLVGQALVVIYGELYLRRWQSKLQLFVLGFTFALVANWVRVFVIIYLGYETNMQSSLIDDHDNFGWWVFAGTLVPLFYMARMIEGRDVRISGDATSTPFEGHLKADGKASIGSALVLALIAFTYIMLPDQRAAIKEDAADYRPDFGQQYLPAFGVQLSGWRPQIRYPDRMYTQTLVDRDQLSAGEGAKQTFYLGVFTYDFQRHRAELVQYSNRLYDREIWAAEAFFSVPTNLGQPAQGITLRHRMTGDRIQLAYLYRVGNQWHTDQWRAKLAQVSGFFQGRKDGSVLIAGVDCDDCGGGGVLAEFINRTFPVLLEQTEQVAVGTRR